MGSFLTDSTKITLRFLIVGDGNAGKRSALGRLHATHSHCLSGRLLAGDAPVPADQVSEIAESSTLVYVVDASVGVSDETRRMLTLCAFGGVNRIVLLVNKLDVVGYSQTVFERIKRAFEEAATAICAVEIQAVPVSAAGGDNFASRSAQTDWYHGPSLIELLQLIAADDQDPAADDFVFQVQSVIPATSNARAFIGTVLQGTARIGATIRVPRTGQSAGVSDLVGKHGSLQTAKQGQSVTLIVDGDIEVIGADLICGARNTVTSSDQFETVLLWLNSDPASAGDAHDLLLSQQRTPVTQIARSRMDSADRSLRPQDREAGIIDVECATLETGKPVLFCGFDRCKTLGSFSLVDRSTGRTDALGIIRRSTRQASNIHRQYLNIGREQRKQRNGHRGKVIWLTELSGSGKSTIASALELSLFNDGIRTFVLDGDNVRHGLNKDLGFTDADRVENIRRVTEVARLMLEHGTVVITSFISPFQRERESAREAIGETDFVEIYLSTPLPVCEQRDVKGLYKKARNGEIPNFSGIDSPYEAPTNPALTLDTSRLDIDSAVNTIRSLINDSLSLEN